MTFQLPEPYIELPPGPVREPRLRESLEGAQRNFEALVSAIGGGVLTFTRTPFSGVSIVDNAAAAVTATYTVGRAGLYVAIGAGSLSFVGAGRLTTSLTYTDNHGGGGGYAVDEQTVISALAARSQTIALVIVAQPGDTIQHKVAGDSMGSNQTAAGTLAVGGVLLGA